MNINKFNIFNKKLLIRIDDIAPNMNWKMMRKIEKLFTIKKIRPVLGVIPNNLDKELLNYDYNKNFWLQVKKWQKKGWEISMHGHTHVYNPLTNEKDFFKYGGNSEFVGLSYLKQNIKISEGLKIFKKNKIKIRSFFAPNHTYDYNTFKALKKNNIKQIIDGYGLFPYSQFRIKFIPQLFYQNITLPIGLQTTQIHFNNWKEKELNQFEIFINKNLKNIISYDEMINNIDNSYLNKITNKLIKITLIYIRKLKPNYIPNNKFFKKNFSLYI